MPRVKSCLVESQERVVTVIVMSGSTGEPVADGSVDVGVVHQREKSSLLCLSVRSRKGYYVET